MRIWQRYFYKEITLTFVFLLASFYGLYIILDLMSHIKDFQTSHTSLRTWITFYACTFSRRLDVLLPFVVLIGTIRVLLHFKSHNILIALMAGGVSLKKLLQPFLIMSIFATCTLYINYEYILPWAEPRSQFIQENNFAKRRFSDTSPSFHECILRDGSKILYRAYDPEEKSFHDVFWIATIDKIYHMKTLMCQMQVPGAKMVDVIQRQPNGHMQKEASFTSLPLPDIEFEEKLLKESIASLKSSSFSDLILQLKNSNQDSERGFEAYALFLFKLTYPLLPLLAFFSIFSFCVHFSRTQPSFMIYLVAISSLFCFLIVLQALLILAKSHIIPASIAGIIPWILAFFIAGRQYAKAS